MLLVSPFNPSSSLCSAYHLIQTTSPNNPLLSYICSVQTTHLPQPTTPILRAFSISSPTSQLSPLLYPPQLFQIQHNCSSKDTLHRHPLSPFCVSLLYPPPLHFIFLRIFLAGERSWSNPLYCGRNTWKSCLDLVVSTDGGWGLDRAVDVLILFLMV